MRLVLGLLFIVVSVWLLVLGFVWFSNFVVEPSIFPVYQMLVDLPESERAAEQCISLPIYPDMLPEQVEIVCEVVKSAL